MAYVGVVKALYDYEAQNPDDELSFKEDQILYIVEKGDDDWWKAKSKDVEGQEGTLGLIPFTYVEELPPMNQTRALYAYEKTSPEELTMDEDAVLIVYDEEDDWLLVRVEGSEELLGFVPKNYCEPFDAVDGVAVPDAADAEAEIEAQRAEEERARAAALQRELQRKDKVETWSVSQLDGKKKKKGTLGVGGGAIFFASESDKSPVKQYPITDLTHVEQSGAKVIVLTVSSLGEPLEFNTGSAKTTKEILAKLATSKQAAGEALQIQADEAAEEEDSAEEAGPTPGPPVMPIPIPEPKQVRFSEPEPTSPAAPRMLPPALNGGASKAPRVESANVLYDFEADGDDELTVHEGEVLTIVDKENDEWWQVRNAQGKEGVVPAQYVELVAGGAAAAAAPVVDHAAASRKAEAEAAAAAAAVEQTRREEAARKEEQRRAIERAAAERAEQEAADRQLAEEIEAEESAKRQQQARQQADHARQQREEEIARRREAARNHAPPAISKRPPPHDVKEAARSLPSGREKSAAPRPTENNRPKPNPQRTRTWSDRTGQFKVDAEFLGMNGDKLRLHKTNGVIIEVPIGKMSGDDAQYVKRVQSRRADREKRQSTVDSDDVPLGWTQPPRRPSQQMSQESASRSAPPKSTRERRPTFDWFAFFLEAGCAMDDCTRYAANFERDRIDESILVDLDPPTMRSLGLREGDVIRVRKHIQVKYDKKAAPNTANDEEYARKLQEQETGGSATAAPGLFTGPNGKLANNTRRGRPERRGTITDTVDTGAIAAAGDQLRKMSLQPIEPTPAPKVATPPVSISMSPPPEEKKPEAPKSGFDDDAWTIKPAAKPASPAPPRATPSPSIATAPANGTDALLAQIQGMRPASTGPAPGGAAFEELARPGPIPQRASTTPQPAMAPPSSYGLGAANTATPMAQLQAQQTAAPQMMAPPQPDPNAPRGPLAPLPVNQGLLNPMQPAMTGMFVPTHNSGSGTQSPFGNSMAVQQTGYMQPMQTGFQQPMQPAYTGFPGYQQPQQQPQQQTAFNAIANMPPPQVPQQTGAGGGGGDQFAPSNIFSAMKRTDFTRSEDTNPQSSNKYDALRPLTTGYNGAPQVYPQATGMPGMQMQPTGMMGMGMQQQQQPQMQMGQMGMPGMMPQMTGYPGQQMGGYMGQGGYGYQ